MAKPNPPKFGRRRLPIPWVISGTLFTFTVTYYYASYRKVLQQPLPTPDTIPNLDITSIYNKTARGFDGDLDRYERGAGISKLRKKLVQLAEGDVLESAVGTGRNSEHYDRKKVRSLTMVDRSQGMLAICQEKWNHEGKVSVRENVKATFLVGDLGMDGVEKVLRPLGDSNRKFDTVVETMGLCSTEDPVKLLENLARTVKSDGKILMLEHGISHYAWVNNLLHRTAIDHAKEHGCWWNRDIGAIVKESGLEVEQIKRYNFGTTWWLELRPKKNQKPEESPSLLKDAPNTPDQSTARKDVSTQRVWWQFW